MMFVRLAAFWMVIIVQVVSPLGSQFAHLIAFEEQFSSESKAINFPFDDPIFPLKLLIIPLNCNCKLLGE